MARVLNGKWYAYFMINGKRFSEPCINCKTEKQAKEYENKLKAIAKKASEQKTVKALVENFKDELTGIDGKINLQDAFNLYLQKPTKRQPSDKRKKLNKRHWSDFVAFMEQIHPDTKTLDQVTRAHAESYITHLKTKGRFITGAINADGKTFYEVKANGAISNDTVNRYHKQCKGVFERLKNDTGMLQNPFDFVMLKADTHSREIFTEEDLKLISDNLDDFNKPLFTIGVFTGLSLGDVCTLKKQDIKGDWIEKKRRKTSAPIEMPILPKLKEFLNALQADNQESDYILPLHAEMYLSNPSGVSLRINKFLKSLGLHEVKEGRTKQISSKDFHSLRHTFAYIAGVNNIPIAIVQSILGHLTPEMTRLYMAHATREEKAQQLAKLPSFLSLGEPVTDPRQELIALLESMPIEKINKVITFAKEI